MLTRRGFLQALGIGAAAAALPALPETDPELLEPRRKLWAVPSNAPVGSRIERVDPGVLFQVNADHGYTYNPSSTAFSLNDAKLSSWSKAFKERYGAFTMPTRESSEANLVLLASAARGEIPPPKMISDEAYALWSKG